MVVEVGGKVDEPEVVEVMEAGRGLVVRTGDVVVLMYELSGESVIIILYA